VPDFACRKNIDGYSVCVTHDEDLDVLAIEDCGGLFCADYGGCRFDADFIERVVASGIGHGKVVEKVRDD
jgi:hypothetical protein